MLGREDSQTPISVSGTIQDIQEIRDPQSIEQIAGTVLLLAVVLPEVDEIEDVIVPWLQVDSESAGALVASLVYVTRGGVKGAQHGDNAV